MEKADAVDVEKYIQRKRVLWFCVRRCYSIGTRASQAQAGSTFRPLEVYLAAACVYLAINLCLAALGRYLEHRMAV